MSISVTRGKFTSLSFLISIMEMTTEFILQRLWGLNVILLSSTWFKFSELGAINKLFMCVHMKKFCYSLYLIDS